MTVKRETLGISPATLRGLGRKTDLTLAAVLALSAGRFKFVTSGPFGAKNKALIDAALAGRKKPE